MKLLKKLQPPTSTASLREVLGLSAAPELAMIRLDDLLAIQAGSGLDPARYLAPQELERYHLFKYEKRRIEWLGGRLTAKKAALDHLDMPVTEGTMRDWSVFADENGRPFFNSAADPEISLSISHSHGLASAMVVTGPACGLDIQKVSGATVRVKEKFCNEGEEKILTSFIFTDPDQPATTLTLLWSAKEALRKALGGHPLTGFLVMTLDEIAPITENSWTFAILVKDRLHRVVVFIYQDYAVAICTA
jgi:phosphopantetheinyl transferase